MQKRILAIILALVMVIGLLPILPASTTAFAASSGSCGENITWSLSSSGTLTITGYGAMYDYNYYTAPWYDISEDVKKVVFINTGSGITSIGSYAFTFCTNLTDITVPSTLTSVGKFAFNNCYALKDFSLPEGVTAIGVSAFSGCESLTKVPSDSRLKNVTSLGSSAFSYCKGITEAVFPPSLTEVPSGLYNMCVGIKKVFIPERITKINSHAFCSCGIEEVFLNNGVTEVNFESFGGCSYLKKIYISNPLTITSSAFSSCPSDMELYIALTESEFTANSKIDESNEDFINAKHNYKSYAVVLNPNGGSGGIFGAAGAPCIFPKAADADFTFSSENSALPTRTGLIFKGWNTKPDGSGKTYLPGEKFTRNATVNLYAQWEADVTRLSGSSRNGTAVAISGEVEKSFEGCRAVVLANGWDFADALAGGPLAKALNASILLITGDEKDEETFAEIERLKVNDIYILGGNVAISDEVQKKLESDGYNVTRIAGSNRFETAVQIAEKTDSLYHSTCLTGFFAYSHNYPDALAVSGIAALMGAPILYINSEGELDPATAAYVSKCHFNDARILGGTGAISSAAETNIKNAGASTVNRTAGSTRYETCLEINKAFKAYVNGGSVCVSTGVNFPDALAGSVLAACNQAPMMLVDPTEPLSAAQKDYIKSALDGNIYIFGGKVAVPEAIESELKTLVS